MAGLLDSLTDGLDADCIAELGDPIIYKKVGQPAKNIYAYVDHNDKTDGFGGVQLTNQDIEIEILKSDVPVVAETDLITLPQLGQSFNPRGASRNSRDGRMRHLYLARAR